MKKFTTSVSQETAFTVSQLNRQIQQLLEASLPWILVEGEISNLAKPSSGHWYFSLKDDKAQIRCAMFKGKNAAVRFKPKDGDMVRLRARVTFYGPRGDCQLSVEGMESAGEGALQQAFERLKNNLQAEGLFAPEHKKPLPTKPERIAIITSPVGAAVRDMIIAFRRRFPLTELTILPSLVQGQDAAKNILRQLQRADGSGHFDAIILGRGGGSLEDLWSFNDETLARAIFAANTPIVSAVGHETDFTISDFVADVRAATPTAAAELLSPDRNQLIRQIEQQEKQLVRRMSRILEQCQQQLDFMTKRIRHPKERIEQQQNQLEQLKRRLQQSMQRKVLEKQAQTANLAHRLERNSPTRRIDQDRQKLKDIDARLARALSNTLTNKQTAFARIIDKLNLVSPLNTLARGYAIASKDKQVIRSIKDVKKGDAISVRVQDGIISCDVTDR
ncbi:MAG: exodeoxyribonuclease VII large subunit [Gammaproteobacteria bacterium]|jgi:exodeoxyribonuclease VII large subunit|uniref:exodeoxyribonuclease VII large subunit n=1 Tax=Marinomonas TaxID=28253 RepID=UPI000C1E38AC|nr:exodeoxyribonuclease VII large subunit [Marinomonas sp. BSi20584]MBU2318780.1 exodeoxyribonuclease VII large subunit [Gammaproteobacteria bacterium]